MWFKHYVLEKNVKKIKLGSLCNEEPCYGVSGTAIPRTEEEQPKYIRITDFDDFGIESTHEYMTVESYTDKHLLQKGDILFARTGGTVGKTYYYDGSIGTAVFAGYCIRFRFDKNKVLPKFVYWNTKTSGYKTWVKGIQRPSGQPNINKEEYKAFEISVPDMDVQVKLASSMDTALSRRLKKREQAERILKDFEYQVSQQCNFNEYNPKRLCFAIKYSQLDGVIDAKRYSAYKSDTAALRVSDICDVLDCKVNVAKYGKEVIDWIRIDDLVNQPSEFLVLRCKEGYNPEAVMAVLKTKYYCELMYAHARGSTPSRYRLNREDMQKLPFPDIKEYQIELAKSANEVRQRVKAMRVQAEEEWQIAKVQFEKELLGE